MIKHVYIYLAVIVLSLLLSPLINKITKINEGYKNITYGKYPDSTDKVLLECSYNLKKNPNLNDMSSEELWIKYPRSNTDGSYIQETNNKRYRNTPDNGKCYPAAFCDSLYDYTEITKPNEISIPKSTNGKRVNFYNNS